MRKRGFTLIELLAVIVILSVIALISTPIIMNAIESSKEKAAVTSAYGYIDAIEYNNSMNSLNPEKYEKIEDGQNINISTIKDKIDLKGTKPESGIVTIRNGITEQANLCMNGYSIEYDGTKAEVNGKCTKNTFKKTGKVVLSSNSGQYTYPNIGTFEIVENASKGKLTCKSDNEEVATCSINETTVTVTPKGEGQATLTIISEETEEYTEGKAVYLVNTEEGLLSVTATGYTGTYDGASHGITVTSSGANIKYGTVSGTYNLTESPKYSEVGSYTVYYQVTKEGYKTVTGSKQVVISKANGTLTLSSTSGKIDVGKSATVTATSTGPISCLSSNTSVATCSVTDKKVTVTGVNAGTATITVTSEATTNYSSVSKTYEVTVEQPLLSTSVKLGDYVKMTPTSTSFTTDTSKTGYTSSQTINPSELNIWRVIRINNDGTIEMVSENVSSVNVYFRGQVGYKNYVGYLNEIAKAYTNTKYVKSTRHMGYNGQTEYLTNTANTVDSTSTTAPWTCSTGESCNPVESQGGGDTLYETDTNLVESALGTLKANKVGNTSSNYWLGSRKYFITSTYWVYDGCYVRALGDLSSYDLYVWNSGFNAVSRSLAVRPILTLKSGLQAVGTGTSSDPYVLG